MSEIKKKIVAGFVFMAFVISIQLLAGCGGIGEGNIGSSESGANQAEVGQIQNQKGNISDEADASMTDASEKTDTSEKADTSKADLSGEADATKVDMSDKSDMSDKAGRSDSTDTSDESNISAADIDAAIDEAKRLAASYDYDKAIAILESVHAESGIGDTGKLLDELSLAKEALVEVDITTIPHIFFHSLIVDTSLAFHNDKDRADDYNRAMTTVDEFNLIIQQMYERGYVLVSLHQMAQYTEGADGSGMTTSGANRSGTSAAGSDAGGKMIPGKIMLPPDKKPIVLSIDDMSYYAYMMEDGFATKLVIGSDGSLTNEMERNDGTVVYGSFDVVPLLDDFIKEHPDFSYQGAKGVIALTGYDGVFGYRTDQDYFLKEHLLYEQAEWLKKHQEFDYEKDIADAKAIAQALRDDGWELASHGWGHRDMNENSMDRFVVDMEKWIDRVESIIGETDILIYPFGTDVEAGAVYTRDNEKYAWLHDHGFHYFCTVNSEQPSVQLGDEYLRQGRINADGYMMYHFPDKLMPYFDVASVFDSARATPVPKY